MKLMFLYKTDVIQCAVPIDIDTEKPGKTVRPIFMFIPYKKPLLSRKYYVNDPRYEREDIHNYQKVKVQDSDYIDYLDFPFVRAQSKHHPPSVGHGADIFFGQAKVAKKIFGHLMNDDVMEALKRWQYDNRGKTKVLM
ncbi:unnamed protein product [Pieris macdunnoughi]|uniref:Uncharacterized protein n=1 Tax=Pieris macdunnoughi TaxID=345717 RepID=A0A821WK72_9NEOP|nr:unnamed protein product [Pieris macdunnoughi]